MFWRSCCWSAWIHRQDIFHPALMEYQEFWGFSCVVANKCIFFPFACICECCNTSLRGAAVCKAASHISVTLRDQTRGAFFPPSTSLEWQSAFQAVREISASPKISGTEKQQKGKLTDITRGGFENRKIQTAVWSGSIVRLLLSVSQSSSVKSVSSASSSIIFLGPFGCTLIISPQGRDSAVHTGHHAKDYGCPIKQGMGRVAPRSFLRFISLLVSFRSVLCQSIHPCY